MLLSTADRLGPYEILGPLGVGGMGEVYRAKDTRLEREVAIKVLPATLAQDPERLARFEREAKVLASLNHPNIAQIYGIEETGSGRALVMELVPGQTLQTPLPLAEALRIAAQIADALESAHDKGIIHRDLKPANIIVTPQGVAKVLDFGLAAVPQRPADGDATHSPTLTMQATQAGMIMGTAGYMSPEQAAGQAVDKRADIWSFGVVLWEMLVGQRMFTGSTVAHILADVLRAPIELEKLPKETPRAVRDLLKRCLDRNVKTRLRDIGEARVAIQNVGMEPDVPVSAAATAAASRRLPWIVAGVLAIGFAASSWIAYRPARPAVLKPLVRMEADLGIDAISGRANTFAISPNGERLVFIMRGADGKTRLATRLLSDDKPTILEGTENPANHPFFSPDGAWIAYVAGSKLYKISTRGGAPVVICDAPSLWGGTWTDKGTLVVAFGANAALSQVASAGGSPQPLGKLSGSDVTQRWPQDLPGGEYVLATSSGSLNNFGSATVVAVSTKTGEVRRLVEGGYFAHYVAGQGGSGGHLLYMRDDSLFAVGFDPTTLEIQGDAVPVAEDVSGELQAGNGHWVVSRNGVLVYRRRGRPANQTWPVLWMDRTGQMRPLVPEPQAYRNMRFSPDGNRLALSVGSDGGADMFVYDVTRDTMARLTSAGKGKQEVDNPTWAPDGKHIISLYPSPSGFRLSWYRADGGGEAQTLLDSNVLVIPTSVSADGKRLLYNRLDPVTSFDAWVLPLDTTDADHPKAGKPEAFLQSSAHEIVPAFSPDGRWVAYSSSESGRFEAYVRPYPGPGGKWQVSKDGGMFPLWSSDGRSLYFRSPDSHIMVADCEATGDVFSPGKARQWSPVPFWSPPNIVPYTLHPDGKRFAVFPVPETAPEEKGNARVTFLLNFGDELRRRLAPAR